MSNYDTNNIFYKIIHGELDCKKVYEDDQLLAFEDKFKVAPVHVLVLPKKPFVDFSDFISSSGEETVAQFFKKVKKISVDILGLKFGYRLITNQGLEAGQTVFHFHVHIIAGKKLLGLIK